MEDLQIQALLGVFSNLDLEKRQSLIPKLTEIAGIITRENVNHLDKEDKSFVDFLFNQTLKSKITRQYMDKCVNTMSDIKQKTRGGEIKEYNRDYSFYLHLDNGFYNHGKFYNVGRQEINKEEFFNILLRVENNTFKIVYIIDNNERKMLPSFFDF